MTTKSDVIKDEVLYAFSVEQDRGANTLGEYLKNYPQFRDELINLSIELLSESSQEQANTNSKAGHGVAKAWKKFQSTLSTSDPVSLSLPICIENPLAKMDKKSFRDLAKSLDLNRVFLARLRDQTIIFSSIPLRFIEIVANATNVSTDALISALNRPSRISPTESFKADGKPEVSEPISFDEAIETSNLSEEQKVTLRAFKD